MDGAILLLLGVLAAAVVYVIISMRNYQRVDYTQLLEQEEYVRALDSRIEYLEQLIATQQGQFDKRERELQALLTAAQQHLAAEVRAAREAIVADVLATPHQREQLSEREQARLRAEQGLLSQRETRSAAQPGTAGTPPPPVAPPASPAPLVEMPAVGPALPATSGRRPSPSPHFAEFLRNPRQAAIANYIEAGYKSADIARLLNVSRHEIELVESILFRNVLSA